MRYGFSGGEGINWRNPTSCLSTRNTQYVTSDIDISICLIFLFAVLSRNKTIVIMKVIKIMITGYDYFIYFRFKSIIEWMHKY